MVADRPRRDPAVVLTETQDERIDAELAKHYQRVQNHLRAG
jgi:hypothetical protein